MMCFMIKYCISRKEKVNMEKTTILIFLYLIDIILNDNYIFLGIVATKETPGAKY